MALWFVSYATPHVIFIVYNVALVICLFVLGLTSLWNIWGHITTVPACSSGTLTNVLPHRNAMPQTQDTTPHPVTVYRHGANLSLCYPSMWNVTLEYTATHFNVLGETRPGNPSPTFHTHQRTFNLMLSWWSTVGSSVESTVPTGSWTRDLWCANPVRYPLAHSDFLVALVIVVSLLSISKPFGKHILHGSMGNKQTNQVSPSSGLRVSHWTQCEYTSERAQSGEI